MAKLKWHGEIHHFAFCVENFLIYFYVEGKIFYNIIYEIMCFYFSLKKSISKKIGIEI